MNKQSHYLFSVLFFIILFIIQSCAPTVSEKFNRPGKRPAPLVQFYRQLDQLVEQEQIKNALGHPIQGFPYLRSNRMLSDLARRPLTAEQKTIFYEYLRRHDLEARKSEIQNLTPESKKILSERINATGLDQPDILIRHLNSISKQLLELDKKSPDFFKAVTEAIEVPDDYSTPMRVFGLYPLFYLPVTYFTSRAYDRIGKWHQTPISQLKVFGTEVSYISDPDQKVTLKEIQELLSGTSKDPFGFMRPDKETQQKLLHFYAPILTQDQVGTYDKIGKMTWNGNHIRLDLNQPTVYYYFNPAWVQNKPVLQINYVVWYPAREGQLTPWFEKGFLDGFNYRVTLNENGTVITADVVYNCGCYHFYIPNKEKIESVIPASFEFDAMVVDWLPAKYPESRLSMKINTGWHQVERVGSYPPKEKQIIYNFIPYEELESLAYRPGQNKSIFNPEGIVFGTERIEPYLLFSMGIPEVGAMRQRGHQPTKLIGRAQFSDPQLLNKNFRFKNLENK